MIKDRYVRWKQYRTIQRELLAYSDSELTELGIARADIGRIAHRAVHPAPTR